MAKIVFEGVPDISWEDGGMAMIGEVDGPDTTFVRIQSWDENKMHTLLKQLVIGQKVRVTVETLD